MKTYQACGVSAAIIDLSFELTPDECAALGIVPGSMKHISIPEKEVLLKNLSHKTPQVSCGGTIANSMTAISQLGGSASLVCALANDEHGASFLNESRRHGLDIISSPVPPPGTATCIALITPDGERAMRTELSGAYRISPVDSVLEAVKNSAWICMDAYMLEEEGGSADLAEAVIRTASASLGKTLLSLADVRMIERYRAEIMQIVSKSDMVFCNESEALALSGRADLKGASEYMQNITENFVITLGSRGSFIRYEGSDFSVPAFQCQPVDVTGAGDIFMGGFLYGISGGTDPAESARKAAYLAMKLITQKGSRLPGDLKPLWNSI